MNPQPEIRPGRVRVNSADLIVNHPDVQVWEIDLASKHPGSFAEFATGTHIGVQICPDEKTLRLDDTADHDAEVLFPVDDSWKWTSIADGSKGTVRVCLYRRP